MSFFSSLKGDALAVAAKVETAAKAEETKVVAAAQSDVTALLAQAAALLTEALPHLHATLAGTELASRIKKLLGI